MERSSIGPRTRSFAMAVLGVVVTFLVFQGLASVMVGVWVFASVPAEELQEMGTNVAAQAEIIGRFTRELLISNSVGQVVGLGLVTLGLARLHSTDVGGLLRLRKSDWTLVGLAVVGVVALQPGVQWLAEINRQIPLPEAVQQFEQSQLKLIETVLKSDTGFWFNLTMMAVVPGIFEELAFRGYVQRQLERAGGPVAGIVLSGLIFGLYHLRLSQFIPLSVLGIFLAYLTWRTGSLIPAILVHFAHNALAVTAARYVETSPSLSSEALQEVSMPLYAVAVGFVFFAGVVYVLHQNALARRPDASGAPTAEAGGER
jgi:membrane protease YdiL (CAAX protease family)